jgi:dTDP-4-amino-4,6-dideoxygalactose transaminase
MLDVEVTFNKASFEGREFEYVSRAINDGHVSGNGPFTRRAEELLNGLHGTGRSLLTTSCTHALEMSALLLNLREGDEVIVPSFTFVSTAAAFLLHGGTPRFVDVRPDTLNISSDAVRNAITSRTRAICIVHYAGVAAEPEVFRQIADEHGLFLIEDNAHGLGGELEGKKLGTFGDCSTLSFHETKNVSCGEGGSLHINRADLLERAEILREKGTNRSRFFRGQVDKYTWVDVGSSWVMSDILAAILTAQLEQYSQIQEKRHKIWSTYFSALSDWAIDRNITMPSPSELRPHTAHMFHLRLQDLDTRTRFIEHLRSKGVVAVFHYQPLHLSNVGRRLGGREGECPITENAANCLVRLPLFRSMSDRDVERVITAVKTFSPS